MRSEWLLYVLLAGLSWGTYVPMIAFGGRTLGGNRFGAKAKCAVKLRGGPARSRMSNMWCGNRRRPV